MVGRIFCAVFFKFSFDLYVRILLRISPKIFERLISTYIYSYSHTLTVASGSLITRYVPLWIFSAPPTRVDFKSVTDFLSSLTRIIQCQIEACQKCHENCKKCWNQCTVSDGEYFKGDLINVQKMTQCYWAYAPCRCTIASNWKKKKQRIPWVITCRTNTRWMLYLR